MTLYSDSFKADVALKSILSTGWTASEKLHFEELIRNYERNIPITSTWRDDANIPSTPPGGSTSEVLVISDLELTPEYSVPDNKVWIVASTPGDKSTRVTTIIPPSFGIGYYPKIYQDDGFSAKGDRIYQGSLLQWVMLPYGVLVFSEDPTNYGLTLPIWSDLYAYQGDFGVSTTAAVDKNYTASFVAVDTWVVNHNLGKEPSITCVDAGGAELGWLTRTESGGNNTTTLVFSSAVTGDVYCN